jgi:hypothetical protein
VWTCSAGLDHDDFLADRPTCGATVAVVRPGSEQRIQFTLLVGGGLLSAGLVGPP